MPPAQCPSRRSLFALDALNVVLADVAGGFGPFLAIYLAGELRWNPEQVGLALAAMGAARLAAQTPAGALIDATRRKRLWLAAAFGLFAASASVMVFWPTPLVVISAQMVVGAAGSMFGPALVALSLGIVGRAALAKRLGRNSALDHAGNVAAALLAGYVGDRYGFGAIFLVAAAACLLGIAVTWLIRPADIDDERARGGDETAVSDGSLRIASYRELCRDRRIVIFFVSVVLFHFANAAMLPLVGQKLTDLSATAASPMSACIIAAQLVMIPVAILSSRLAESWGRKATLLIAFGVLPIRGALYVLSDSPYYLVAVQLLDGLGAGVINVVGVLMIADLTRGTGRFNLMQGALATATGTGALLSNLATGTIVNRFGYSAGFLSLAAIAALALVFFAAAMPETGNPIVPNHEPLTPLLSLGTEEALS